MPFVKGKSGNPAGRKKLPEGFLFLARSQTEKNLRTMMELRDNADDNPTRLRAAIALHEIAWGKPVQAVTGAEGGPILVSWQY